MRLGAFYRLGLGWEGLSNYFQGHGRDGQRSFCDCAYDHGEFYRQGMEYGDS